MVSIIVVMFNSCVDIGWDDQEPAKVKEEKQTTKR